MTAEKNAYIVIFGKNTFECLQLIFFGWIRRSKLLIIAPSLGFFAVNYLRQIPVLKNYTSKEIKEYEYSSSDHKVLWYEAHQETIDLTLRFYNAINEKDKIIAYYNNLLSSNKFEAFIKKNISNEIFYLLKDLHIIRLSVSGINEDNTIVIIRNPLNEFVVGYMEDRYGIVYKKKWIKPIGAIMSLCMYGRWICMEFMRRGIVFNKGRKEYKISVEPVCGFSKPTLRDDMVIDGRLFKMSDVLMLELIPGNAGRAKAFEEARKKGFDGVSVPKLKINVTKNILNLFFFYFLVPIKMYFILLFKHNLYLLRHLLSFHRECFPMEILLNLYKIDLCLQNNDWGGVAETVILNKYGTQSVALLCSDLSPYKGYHHEFIAHNIYFSWGNIHRDHYLGDYLIDHKINIGCIYKDGYNKVFKDKDGIMARIPGLKKGQKVIAFYDTSFASWAHHTEDVLLKYLDVIAEYCMKEKNNNVLLKPKHYTDYGPRLSYDNRKRHKKLWDYLTSTGNFVCIDPSKWSMEEILAISDISINMGMNSPATVALICGKNALYYDTTGNSYHLFAKKYKNKIVFDDKNLLFKQIDDILGGKINCRDIIEDKDIRQLDAFADDRALDRMRSKLYELTKGSL